jgi:hypothetical protein
VWGLKKLSPCGKGDVLAYWLITDAAHAKA